MLLNEKFNYPKIKREDGQFSRHYISPETREPLPSVTTILSKTKDYTHINEWTERVGKEEAERIRDEAGAIGTLMHAKLEDHIQGTVTPQRNTMMNRLATKMAEKIIQQAFPKIQEVWGYEKTLYYSDLYAGTADLIGVYDGGAAIMDYKNTRTMKKAEWIDDYFCQGAAYSLAHNYMFGTNINKISIFMVDRELNYNTFIVEGNDFEKYSYMWAKRVDEYFSK